MIQQEEILFFEIILVSSLPWTSTTSSYTSLYCHSFLPRRLEAQKRWKWIC